MKKTKFIRISAFLLAALMAVGLFAGCQSDDDSKGKVYYLNFKPEADEAWQNLAEKYTRETGIQVDVETAAEGTYQQTLTSEMDKDEPPTLFQINNSTSLAVWGDFCVDLKGTDIYKELVSDNYALFDKKGKVCGVGYVIESYGIIYNKKLLQKYCDSGFATVKKIEDINSFEKLRTAADEIQKNKDKLGVEGAFTCAGMDSSSDWRFKTHLANMPIHFEYEDRHITDTMAIKGTYLPNFKNIWDLYITDTTCKKTELASKTELESETEFINGKAVFFQNGTWEYDALKNGGMKDDELGMLPIYIGAGDEKNQGLCSGTENYWCINNMVSEKDQKATEDFINWCVTSQAGTKAMAEDMNFEIPFRSAEKSNNLFVKINKQLNEQGKTAVRWDFTTIPSEEWKDGLGASMTQYAAGTGDWDAVKRAFVDSWAKEKKKTEE